MNRRLALFSAAGCSLTVAAVALAQPQSFLTWNGPANGPWSSPGNWTPVGVPNNNAGSTYAAIIPGGGSPVIAGGFTIDKFGIQPGGAITVNNNSFLAVRGTTDGSGLTGILSNEGTLTLNSAGNLTDLIISGGAGAYAVHGNIFGTTARFLTSNSTANRIYGQTGVEKLIFGAETLFEGAASIGINLTELENFGRIRAVGNQGVYIDPNGAGMTNHNILEAATGPLVLWNGVFRNPGNGSIVASAGQTAFLQSARIEGGLLNTAINGFITLQGSTLADTRVMGNVRVPNNSSGALETALLLQAAGSNVTLDSGGNLTDLIMAGNVTIHGSSFNAGVLSSNSTANRIYSNNSGRLTLADTAFIRGSMSLGINLMSLTVNELCAVEAMGNQGLVIDPDANGVINAGFLRAKDGATLFLTNGTFDNTQGDIEAESGGTVSIIQATVNGGNLMGGGSFVLNGCELSGNTSTASLTINNTNNAVLRTSLINNATLALNSGGNLTDLIIRGNTTLSGSGVVTASNSTANRIYAENGPSRLTNAAGHTIRGSMSLGVNLMTMTNNGLIEAAGNQGITIDMVPPGIENNNLIRANSGSPLTLANSTVDNVDGVISALDGGSCTIQNTNIIGGLLTTAGTGFFQSFSGELDGVTSSGAVRIPNTSNLFLRNTLVNNSTLLMNSGGNLTDLIIRGDVTVSGSGQVSASNSTANRMYAESSASRLTNAAGHTIRGSMSLGVNLMTMTNNGLIEAVGNQGMTIDVAPPGLDNNGLIRAAPGSSVTLLSSTFDNADGVIIAQAGGVVSVSSSLITGGNITSAGSGFFQSFSGELSSVTSTAVVNIPNTANMYLRGVMTNNNAINMNSGGNLTDLIIRGDVTLTGTGALNASNSTANRIYAENGSHRLTNGVGHTIRGSMSLGINNIALTNQGNILADGNQGVLIDANANGFDNQGELHAVSGNISIGADPFTTSGTVIADAGRTISRSGNWTQTGGSVVANGVISISSGSYLLQGGSLGGTGTINANVTNSTGTMAPGNATGILTINGNYSQLPTGRFEFQVGTVVDPALNDTLYTVGGSATLNGVVRISRTPGFVPPIGQGFTIVGTPPNQRFGAFSAIESNDFWHIAYLHNAAVAVFDGLGPTPCPADFNQDGDINADDLGDFITCYFSTPPCPGAEFNNDGNINPDDLGDFITTYFGPAC